MKKSNREVNRQLLALNLLNDAWSEEKQLKTLYALSNYPEKHYTCFWQRKPKGGKRQILAPDNLLKSVQRNILANVLTKLPISEYAAAYFQGAGLREHAKKHLSQPLVLKLDIKDFFDNITFAAVYQSAFAHLPKAVGTLLCHLCCYREFLPQGAPTSPAISNLVLKGFDEMTGAWCAEKQIVYSRYCDDLIFSGGFEPRSVIAYVQRLLYRQGFQLNGVKTKALKASDCQIVTGVVVNEKLQTAKNYRKKLRQELYYADKFGAKSHLEQIEDERFLPADGENIRRFWLHLLGKVNFVLQINPLDEEFIQAREKIAGKLAVIE